MLAWRAADPFRVPAVTALLAQTAWVVWVGGDFMAGRFLTVPLLLAVLLLARVPLARGGAWGAATALVVVVVAVPALSPFASRDYGEDWHAAIDDRGVADERHFHLESTSLRAVRAGTGWRGGEERAEAALARQHYAADPWLEALTAVGVLDEQGAWPAPGGQPESEWPPVFVKGGVGLFGFRMGPDTVVIDYHALGDPLLARLPAEPRDPVLARLIPRLAHLDWRTGHYLRAVPGGYALTRASGENRLRDPDLRELYETIQVVVSGPVLRVERARAIARLHSSWADERVEAYLERRAAAGEAEPISGLRDAP